MAETNHQDRYRDALQWTFERLGVDYGMTEQEQRSTFKEIGNVLLGRPTPQINAWRRRIAKTEQHVS